MQTKLPLEFQKSECGCGCIFNHFEIPEDTKWVFDLMDKYAKINGVKS